MEPSWNIQMLGDGFLSAIEKQHSQCMISVKLTSLAACLSAGTRHRRRTSPQTDLESISHSKNKHHLLGETEQFLNRKTSFGLEFNLFIIEESFQDFTVNLSQPTSTVKRILVYWIGLYTGWWSILPPVDMNDNGIEILEILLKKKSSSFRSSWVIVSGFHSLQIKNEGTNELLFNSSIPPCYQKLNRTARHFPRWSGHHCQASKWPKRTSMFNGMITWTRIVRWCVSVSFFLEIYLAFALEKVIQAYPK